MAYRNAIAALYDRFKQPGDEEGFDVAMQPVPVNNAILQALSSMAIPTSEQEAFAAMPREQQDTARLPMGSFRNNTTGRTQYFGPQGPRDTPYSGDELATAQGQPQRVPIRLAGFSGSGTMSDLGETMGAAPAIDASRGAIDTPLGRGQYGRDGKVYVRGADGTLTRVVLGYDPDASYLAAKRNFDRRKSQSELDSAEVSREHTQESTEALRAQRMVKEDMTSQAALEKRYGKPEPGMRWTPDGRLEPVPGGTKNADADSVLELLKMAEPLLESATGSYLGVAADKINQAFGHSTTGSERAAQLKAIEGALVAKMPKMSGPQSDKDVLLYRQMAGEIGDPTIPAERKKAAMYTIRKINEQYATPGGSSNAASKPQGGTQFNAMPDPRQYKGRRLRSDQGITYRSDGARWVRE